MRLLILFLCLLAFSFLSCTSETRDSALEWYADTENGYTLEKEVAGLHYIVSYQPSEYTLLRTLKHKNYTKGGLQKLKDKYGDGGYFKVQINPDLTNESALQRIQGLTNYYTRNSFDPSQMSLVTYNDDTLIATFFHSERAYELSQQVSILVGFDEKIETNKKYKFIYRDHLINQAGLSFQFEFKKGPDCSNTIDCINNYKK